MMQNTVFPVSLNLQTFYKSTTYIGTDGILISPLNNAFT